MSSSPAVTCPDGSGGSDMAESVRLFLADEAATRRLAEALAPCVGAAGGVVTLGGALGAGKTAFARALIRALTGDPDEEVPSPTFTLVQGYDTPHGALWHFDLYRLTSPDEVIELDWEEAVVGGLVLVEWPERAGRWMPAERLEIALAAHPAVGPDARIATLTAHGHWASVLRAVSWDRVPLGHGSDGASPETGKDLTRFLAAHDLLTAERHGLAGDASARRYQRLNPIGRAPLILMQAPDPARDLVPFVTVAELLRPLGLSVPAILAVNAEAGLMLLEDFGDAAFTRCLDLGAPPEPLYRLAVDVLIRLHQGFVAGPAAAALPVFDLGRFLDQAMLFADLIPPAITGRPLPPAARLEFETAWREILPGALTRPTLLLRDYHAGNLMHLPDRPGVRACGLLDIQDAGIGPAAYDLVSLIEDARRDLVPALAGSLVGHYRAAFPDLDAVAFRRSWSVLAAVRHTRVIAVFQRLAGQGKPGYLGHTPRVWRYLAAALARPELEPLTRWFDRHLPLATCVAATAVHEPMRNEAT